MGKGGHLHGFPYQYQIRKLVKTHIVEYKGIKVYYYEPLYKVDSLDFPDFDEAKKYIDKITQQQEDLNNYYPTKTKPQ